jgi:hypothetical protein
MNIWNYIYPVTYMLTSLQVKYCNPNYLETEIGKIVVPGQPGQKSM